MKNKLNKKIKLFVIPMFAILIGSTASCSLLDNIDKIINPDTNVDNDGEEFEEGTSFLNFGSIKGLKNTEYTLIASVTPVDHTGLITWTSDYPDYVTVTAGDNDTAIVTRTEDFRGYVNITASIDGVSATCKVYTSDIKTIGIAGGGENFMPKYNGAYYSTSTTEYVIRGTISMSSTILDTDYVANGYDYELISSEYIQFVGDSFSSPSFGHKSVEFQFDENDCKIPGEFYWQLTIDSPTSDYTFIIGSNRLTLNFMEYVTATGITLDKSTTTI